MTRLSNAPRPDAPLMDVGLLNDDARGVLRQIREVLNQLDGGEDDHELAGNGGSQGPGVKAFDAAISLLFTSAGKREILDMVNDGLDDSAGGKNPADTSSLKKTTPDFAMLSLARQRASRIADEFFGVKK